MKTKILSLIAIALTLSACNKEQKDFDATGNFEATETTVYSQQNGQLLFFNVEEGGQVAAGQEVGSVDTTQLQLQINQIISNKTVLDAQQPDVASEIAATEEQLIKAQQEYRRYSELVADGAAPRKQKDDAESQVKVIKKQLEALKVRLDHTQNTLDAQKLSTDKQVSQVREQISKCHIYSPTSGTVLEKYVEPGEVVAAGKPLFKLADVSEMYLRAYVTSEQLSKVKLGQTVKVSSDYGNGQGKTYDGVVTWISSKSEFTPKTIQTDDERADLVYAVKIRVKNDGLIKIGMYGKLKL